MSEYTDLERRVSRVEIEIDKIEERLSKGAKTMQKHETMITGLCSYQEKQNGALNRLAEKLEEHVKWMNRWMYGIGVGIIMLLLGVLANFIYLLSVKGGG